MNEKDQPMNFPESVPPTMQCQQAGELVSYLYGETTAAEAQSFSQHLRDCASCADELDAFGDTRAAVRTWRQEAVSLAHALSFNEPLAHAVNAVAGSRRPRSARAAWRAFFTLSPRWLQAGSVAAWLLMGALAALLVAGSEVRWDAQGFVWQTGISSPRRVAGARTIEAPTPGSVSPEQVREMVAGYQHEVETLRRQLRQQAGQLSGMTLAGGPVAEKPKLSRPAGAAPHHPRRAPRGNSAGRVTTDLRRNGDLAEVDDDLPRLSDLLREVN